jgi:hypothetical protein
MALDDASITDRRAFLQAGAVATASALVTASATQAQDGAPQPMKLPRRALGKTGVDITILDQGTGKGPDVDRLLRYGFARGVRAYDTSETYHSECATRILVVTSEESQKRPGTRNSMHWKRPLNEPCRPLARHYLACPWLPLSLGSWLAAGCHPRSRVITPAKVNAVIVASISSWR